MLTLIKNIPNTFNKNGVEEYNNGVKHFNQKLFDLSINCLSNSLEWFKKATHAKRHQQMRQVYQLRARCHLALHNYVDGMKDYLMVMLYCQDGYLKFRRSDNHWFEENDEFTNIMHDDGKKSKQQEKLNALVSEMIFLYVKTKYKAVLKQKFNKISSIYQIVKQQKVQPHHSYFAELLEYEYFCNQAVEEYYNNPGFLIQHSNLILKQLEQFYPQNEFPMKFALLKLERRFLKYQSKFTLNSIRNLLETCTDTIRVFRNTELKPCNAMIRYRTSELAILYFRKTILLYQKFCFKKASEKYNFSIRQHLELIGMIQDQLIGLENEFSIRKEIAKTFDFGMQLLTKTMRKGNALLQFRDISEAKQVLEAVHSMFTHMRLFGKCQEIIECLEILNSDKNVSMRLKNLNEMGEMVIYPNDPPKVDNLEEWIDLYQFSPENHQTLQKIAQRIETSPTIPNRQTIYANAKYHLANDAFRLGNIQQAISLSLQAMAYRCKTSARINVNQIISEIQSVDCRNYTSILESLFQVGQFYQFYGKVRQAEYYWLQGILVSLSTLSVRWIIVFGRSMGFLLMQCYRFQESNVYIQLIKSILQEEGVPGNDEYSSVLQNFDKLQDCLLEAEFSKNIGDNEMYCIKKKEIDHLLNEIPTDFSQNRKLQEICLRKQIIFEKTGLSQMIPENISIETYLKCFIHQLDFEIPQSPGPMLMSSQLFRKKYHCLLGRKSTDLSKFYHHTISMGLHYQVDKLLLCDSKKKIHQKNVCLSKDLQNHFQRLSIQNNVVSEEGIYQEMHWSDAREYYESMESTIPEKWRILILALDFDYSSIRVFKMYQRTLQEFAIPLYYDNRKEFTKPRNLFAKLEHTLFGNIRCQNNKLFILLTELHEIIKKSTSQSKSASEYSQNASKKKEWWELRYETDLQVSKILKRIQTTLFPEDLIRSMEAETPSHTILIADQFLHQIPFESLSMFCNQSISRMPSLLSLYATLKTRPSNIVTTDKTYYLLNPSSDLQTTEDYFRDFVCQFKSWNGLLGKEPSPLDFENAFSNHSMYIYCGHGAGEQYYNPEKLKTLNLTVKLSMLMGCGSARLETFGQYESSGTVYQYLESGVLCVVGNLWDITNRDCDRFTKHVIENFIKSDKDLPSLVPKARYECKLRHLIGSSAIVYGIPVVREK